MGLVEEEEAAGVVDGLIDRKELVRVLALGEEREPCDPREQESTKRLKAGQPRTYRICLCNLVPALNPGLKANQLIPAEC